MEYIQIICSIISAISTIIIALQFVQAERSEKKHHEEMRRSKTIDIMQDWNNSLRKETSYAEKIVHELDEKQCRELYFSNRVQLELKTGKKFCQICSQRCEGCKKCMEIQDGFFVLESVRLSEFRWYVISYLNMLETVMTAWNLGIVDREEIERQFRYLYNPQKGQDALKHFRKAAGGEGVFPNIAKFINMLEEKHSSIGGKPYDEL